MDVIAHQSSWYDFIFVTRKWNDHFPYQHIKNSLIYCQMILRFYFLNTIMGKKLDSAQLKLKFHLPSLKRLPWNWPVLWQHLLWHASRPLRLLCFTENGQMPLEEKTACRKFGPTMVNFLCPFHVVSQVLTTLDTLISSSRLLWRVFFFPWLIKIIL